MYACNYGAKMEIEEWCCVLIVLIIINYIFNTYQIELVFLIWYQIFFNKIIMNSNFIILIL